MSGSGTCAVTVCKYCNGTHAALCPMIKAIEYFENGTVKRVEFKTQQDYYLQPIPMGGQHIPIPNITPSIAPNTCVSVTQGRDQWLIPNN